MEKAIALAKLHAVREIFDVSVGAYVLLTEEPARSELASYSIRYDDAGHLVASKHELPAAGLGISFQIRFQETSYVAAAKALVERSLRQMVLESLDTVKTYAKAIEEDVRTEPWFLFAKHYRDAAAHDGKWDLSKIKDEALPLTCMNLVVDRSLDGTPIEGFLSWYKARQLVAKMALYVGGDRNLA